MEPEISKEPGNFNGNAISLARLTNPVTQVSKVVNRIELIQPAGSQIFTGFRKGRELILDSGAPVIGASPIPLKAFLYGSLGMAPRHPTAHGR